MGKAPTGPLGLLIILALSCAASCAYQLTFAKRLQVSAWEQKKTVFVMMLDVVKLLGLMGACNLLFYWVFIVILHFTGVETFRLPLEMMIEPPDHLACCWSEMTDVFSYYVSESVAMDTFFLIGIALTGPLFMSVSAIGLGTWNTYEMENISINIEGLSIVM